MRALRFAAIAFASAFVAACFVTIDDSLADRTEGDASTADAGGDAIAADVNVGDGPSTTDGQTESAAPSCPSAMVQVPRASGGADYCVDATEVTNAAYAAFLAAAPTPTPAGQRSECAWNTTWTPQGWTGTETPGLPVVGVDWCDAVGFCAFYNKRLCGKIGGGPVDSTSGAVYDKAQGEWYGACSRGGARAFPYGATYDPQACNGADYGSPHLNQPNVAGQTATCKGGFDAIFDMSGNVQEWLDSCETPSPHLPQCTDAGPQCDLCRSGGGGFATPQSRLNCSGGDLLLRDEHFADTGFRCCADLR